MSEQCDVRPLLQSAGLYAGMAAKKMLREPQNPLESQYSHFYAHLRVDES